MADKKRLDILLVERGLVTSRARAQAMLLAGHVLVNDQPETKAGLMVLSDVEIRLREPELKYVSRGALKLKKALDHFQIQATKKHCLDVGASTGGFTEVLLENGASHVTALDVGTNQLAWKIRTDPRVTVLEKVNVRFVKPTDFPRKFELVVTDVSFISVRMIRDAVVPLIQDGGNWVILFKPQFEVGKNQVGTGGIVRDQEVARQVMQNMMDEFEAGGLQSLGSTQSPIDGTDGNVEYLVAFQKKA